eukprot:997343-Ditylum_brightwellii.AAC.2
MPGCPDLIEEMSLPPHFNLIWSKYSHAARATGLYVEAIIGLASANPQDDKDLDNNAILP